jgi:hypothetical protein
MAGAAAGVLMLLASTASAANIVVNCIGEQTTTTGEGSTMAQNWPPVLGGLLGTGYTVNNDGVNAGKVIDGSAKSATSLMGSPGIIVIGPFAEHDYAATITEAQWQTAYENLVDAYLALTPVPKVYVMTPPPAAFVYQSAAEQTFASTIVKTAVLAVATAKNLKVIDLFDDTALGAAGDMAGDGHFNPAGMAEVAKLAYEAITGGADAGGGGGSGASTGTSGTSSGMSGGSGESTGASGTSTGASGTSPGSGTSSGMATTGMTATSGTIAPSSGTVPVATTGSTSGDVSATSGTVTSTAGSSESGSNSAASGTGGGTTTTEAAPKSSSGCTMGAAGSSGAAGGLLSLVGLAFIVSRKRSSRRS